MRIIKRLWRKLCHKIFRFLFRYICSHTGYLPDLISIIQDSFGHNELLKDRLIAKRSELAILKHQSRAYVRLRVLAKEIVCHGAHVSYSGAKTVKIKISRQLHDKLLATIEDIEDKKIWIG